MATEKGDKPASARERRLDAANHLFYAEGVHTVGVDRVVERAGVAKATLYALFGNKDGLVRAYLMVRDEAIRGRMIRRLGSGCSGSSTYRIACLASQGSAGARSRGPAARDLRAPALRKYQTTTA